MLFWLDAFFEPGEVEEGDEDGEGARGGVYPVVVVVDLVRVINEVGGNIKRGGRRGRTTMGISSSSQTGMISSKL